jgi:subtilase family serine protease
MAGAVAAFVMLAGSLGPDSAPSASAQTPQTADLRLTIAGSATKIGLNEEVTFTYTMRNDGNLNAGVSRMAGSVDNAAQLTITQQPGNGNPNCTVNGTAVECAGLVLPAGQAVTLKVKAKAPNAPGFVTARGTMDVDNQVPEPNVVNNTDAESVTVFERPDLIVAVSGPSQVGGGQQVEYLMTVTNQGGATEPAKPVKAKFSSSFDTNYLSLQFVGASQDFSCQIKEPVLARNFVECTGGQLEKGESMTLKIVAIVKKQLFGGNASGTIDGVVDPDNTIVESKENNNTDSQTITRS